MRLQASTTKGRDEEEDWDDDPYSLNSEDDGPENIDLDNDFDPYQ